MFYDFGFGNETAYYDITKNNGGVPCSDRRTGRGREELFSQEPAEGCFTGLYSTDAFVGRARQVIGLNLTLSVGTVSRILDP